MPQCDEHKMLTQMVERMSEDVREILAIEKHASGLQSDFDKRLALIENQFSNYEKRESQRDREKWQVKLAVIVAVLSFVSNTIGIYISLYAK